MPGWQNQRYSLPEVFHSYRLVAGTPNLKCLPAHLIKQLRHNFLFIYTKTYNMKRLSIIVAMLIVIGVSISSCSAGAHLGTKHHGVSAGAKAH
jgi:hypothetical protein